MKHSQSSKILPPTEVMQFFYALGATPQAIPFIVQSIGSGSITLEPTTVNDGNGSQYYALVTVDHETKVLDTVSFPKKLYTSILDGSVIQSNLNKARLRVTKALSLLAPPMAEYAAFFAAKTMAVNVACLFSNTCVVINTTGTTKDQQAPDLNLELLLEKLGLKAQFKPFVGNLIAPTFINIGVDVSKSKIGPFYEITFYNMVNTTGPAIKAHVEITIYDYQSIIGDLTMPNSALKILRTNIGRALSTVSKNTPFEKDELSKTPAETGTGYDTYYFTDPSITTNKKPKDEGMNTKTPQNNQLTMIDLISATNLKPQVYDLILPELKTVTVVGTQIYVQSAKNGLLSVPINSAILSSISKGKSLNADSMVHLKNAVSDVVLHLAGGVHNLLLALPEGVITTTNAVFDSSALFGGQTIQSGTLTGSATNKTPIDLAQATEVGTIVSGTTKNVVYHVVAITDTVNVAIRYSNDVLSVRIAPACNLPSLVRMQLYHLGIKIQDTYLSAHYSMNGSNLLLKTTIGSVLSIIGLHTIKQMADINTILTTAHKQEMDEL